MSLRQKQIIEFIQHNPNCTSFDISEAIGISSPMVRNYLRRLKNNEEYNDILICNTSIRDDIGRPFITYSIDSTVSVEEIIK